MSTFAHQFVPGKNHNTLLLLHGTGGDENDLIPIGRALAPGWTLLSPRGKVLENGAPRFFRRLSPGIFDEEDIRIRAAELARFVSESAAGNGFDRAVLRTHRFSRIGITSSGIPHSTAPLMAPK